MKIAVVGAGAMGSLFGGLLAESENEAWLVAEILLSDEAILNF